MGLIKTSILSAISTLIRIIAGFVVNKVVAVYIGPAGLALVGQFQNFLSIVMTFGSGAVNQGVTKYIAEYNDSPSKQKKVLVTAIKISVICSLFVGFFLSFFSRSLSQYLLNSDKYMSIFIVSGILMVLYAVNGIFLAALNGYKEIKKYIFIGIISSIGGLFLTVLLSIYYRLFGALLSLILSQTLIFFVTFFFIYRSNYFSWDILKEKVDIDMVKCLLKFALMAVISALTVPVAQIFIRNYIIGHLSVADAGYWQGVWKISEVYLMLITMTLSIYYLPKLSEIKGTNELRKEIFHGYKTLLPIMIICTAAVYFSRDFIVHILFTKDFIAMKPLFLFQLIGDFFKIASWLLSFLMVAKSMTRHFIVTEILFSLSFALLSILFINRYGLIGVTYAFALNYLGYLLAMIWIFRGILLQKQIL